MLAAVMVILIFSVITFAIIKQVYDREQKRLESMKSTIAGAHSLEQALQWYPPEMHDEVRTLWSLLGREDGKLY